MGETEIGDPLRGVPTLQELAEVKYVTLSKAVDLTGFTYQTLLKYVKPTKKNPKPRLKAYRVGNEWRITEGELRRFLSGTTS